MLDERPLSRNHSNNPVLKKWLSPSIIILLNDRWYTDYLIPTWDLLFTYKQQKKKKKKYIYAILGPFWIFQSSSVNIDLLELSSDEEQEI